MKTSFSFLALGIFLSFFSCTRPEKLPNILWITSEDNSPLLGCYGDSFATTPHLDFLATEGFLYTNAYANTPVCAPARNTILTGVYACSNGNEHMRSRYAKSDLVRPYTEFLIEKGYYCTNNSKTDYNYANPDLETIWNECGKEAHYKGRREGQPFFAIFNLTTSHESCIHKFTPDSLLRHRPEEVKLPPYHPDTPEMRHDWAQYYDRVEDMDAQVGTLLEELEKAGLSENTIVIYCSDHGGVLGRSKRFLYETGTHVPMIIRIPDSYKKLFPAAKKGSKLDRLVSFIDMAPTLLSLTGTAAPDYMQGDAFLGKYKREDPDFIYMFRDRMDGRYDLARSVVDGSYRYTRYFNPTQPWMQHLQYQWRAPSMQSWERAWQSGLCDEIQARYWKPKDVEELFDIKNDPWEVNNLAADPFYESQVAKMREQMFSKGIDIRDAGFIPEAERIVSTGEQATYDYMRSASHPFREIQEAAFLATEADPANLEQMLLLLENENSAIRYWGAQGLLILGEAARPAVDRVEKAAFDSSWNVSIAAAELLYKLGEKEAARQALNRVLKCEEVTARACALNCIDVIGEGPENFKQACLDLRDNYDVIDRQYDIRVAQGLFIKWHIPWPA